MHPDEMVSVFDVVTADLLDVGVFSGGLGGTVVGALVSMLVVALVDAVVSAPVRAVVCALVDTAVSALCCFLLFEDEVY
jgi:hypothetical protein